MFLRAHTRVLHLRDDYAVAARSRLAARASRTCPSRSHDSPLASSGSPAFPHESTRARLLNELHSWDTPNVKMLYVNCTNPLRLCQTPKPSLAKSRGHQRPPP